MKIKNEKYIMPKTCIFANNIVGYIFVTNIVTDFTTSVFISSCNYHLSTLLSLFCFSFYFLESTGRIGGQELH